jgi:tRNA isopentenyl-2-thiomethyl-A-37 hydroxylase MiaE
MQTKLGKNRTGIDMSPIDSSETLQGSERSMPTSEGDEGALAAIRADYIREADPVGSVPPPGTLKGALKSGVQMLSGNRPEVLLDKLGERLAFERGGTRLYEALITKCLAGVDGSDMVQMDVLERIHDEELRHMELVGTIIESMGADPTAMTPCADVTGVASLGLVQVLTDPRTTLAQCLDAMLIAELTDTAGWEMLISLMEQTGNNELITQMTQAHDAEQEHLLTVKQWLKQLTLQEAKVLSST